MVLGANDYLAQVELATDSNVAADNIINTFAVQFVGSTLNLELPSQRIVGFYSQIESYLANTLASTTDAHTIKWYRLSEPQPRPPIYLRNFTNDGGNSAYPAEVACCSSFSAPVTAGVLPARRRGRIYVGPLNANTGEAVGGYIRPSAAFRTALATATEDLVSGLDEDLYPLCVWSRADSTLYPVTHGWVNDEFDTMRSRGPEVTTRTTWSIST